MAGVSEAISQSLFSSRSKRKRPAVPATSLMNVQLGMGIAGNAVLIVSAIFVLVWWPLSNRTGPSPPAGRWAGSPWPVRWRRAASGLPTGPSAVGQRRRADRHDGDGPVGLHRFLVAARPRVWRRKCRVGLSHLDARLGRLCLVHRVGHVVAGEPEKRDSPLLPERPERCLAHMGTVPFFPPQSLLRAAAIWVRLSGVLAVLLGLKAALFPYGYEERLWAAAAIAIASGAGATMAVWCRREGWAFSAALGVNLAASLVVWYFHRDVGSFGQWWLHLVEANVIASATVALAWLAAQKRLYQTGKGDSPHLPERPKGAPHKWGRSPFSASPWQYAFPRHSSRTSRGRHDRHAGDAGVLVGRRADVLAGVAGPLADAPGWLALLLAAAAAAWYLGRVLPGNLIHVAAGLLLGIGVLMRCHVGQFNKAPGTDSWLAYHTLVAAWASAALLVLGVAVRHSASGGLFPEFSPAAGEVNSGIPLGSLAKPRTTRSIVQGWVTAIGAAVVVLAVMHVLDDRAGAWWSIRAIASISAPPPCWPSGAGCPPMSFISGLLLNVAGVVGWLAWGPTTLENLVSINVLCLAAGSAAWSLLEGVPGAGVPHGRLRNRPLPFAHLAAMAAVGLLAALVAAGMVAELFRLPDLRLEIGRIDWIALGAAVAVALCLWDRKARFVLPGLYFLGLSAAGMVLCAARLDPLTGCWWAALGLSAFALSASVLGWLLPRIRAVGRLLRIPDAPDRWPVGWLMSAQAVLFAASAALAAWVSLDVGLRRPRRPGGALRPGRPAGRRSGRPDAVGDGGRHGSARPVPRGGPCGRLPRL